MLLEVVRLIPQEVKESFSLFLLIKAVTNLVVKIDQKTAGLDDISGEALRELAEQALTTEAGMLGVIYVVRNVPLLMQPSFLLQFMQGNGNQGF